LGASHGEVLLRADWPFAMALLRVDILFGCREVRSREPTNRLSVVPQPPPGLPDLHKLKRLDLSCAVGIENRGL